MLIYSYLIRKNYMMDLHKALH